MGGAFSIIATIATSPFIILGTIVLRNKPSIQMLSSIYVFIISFIVWYLTVRKVLEENDNGRDSLLMFPAYISSVVFLVSATLIVLKLTS